MIKLMILLTLKFCSMVTAKAISVKIGGVVESEIEGIGSIKFRIVAPK